jgi:hypothetical protein
MSEDNTESVNKMLRVRSHSCVSVDMDSLYRRNGLLPPKKATQRIKVICKAGNLKDCNDIQAYASRSLVSVNAFTKMWVKDSVQLGTRHFPVVVLPSYQQEDGHSAYYPRNICYLRNELPLPTSVHGSICWLNTDTELNNVGVITPRGAKITNA